VRQSDNSSSKEAYGLESGLVSSRMAHKFSNSRTNKRVQSQFEQMGGTHDKKVHADIRLK